MGVAAPDRREKRQNCDSILLLKTTYSKAPSTDSVAGAPSWVPTTRRTIQLGFVMIAGFLGAAAYAQDVPITLRLTSALSAGSAQKGDQFTAQIASPDSLKGDTVRATVTQVAVSHGQALVEFSVDSLHHSSGVDIPLAANVQGVSNSKGEAGVDDQGRAVHAMFVQAKAPGRNKIGKLGGMLGGRLGNTVSQAPDTAGSPAAIQIAAQGSAMELGSGSMIMLIVHSTNDTSLGSVMASAPAAAPTSAAAQETAKPASSASPSAAAGGQPELKATKIEFVPGERTIFYEDFSDMTEGEPPPHWKVREGTVELRTGGGIRELYAESGVHLFSPSFAIPKNFTLEVEWTGTGEMLWKLRDKGNSNIIEINVSANGAKGSAAVAVLGQGLGSAEAQVDPGKPFHFALWAQQGRVRAYINGQRLVDANQVEFDPMDNIYLDFARSHPNGLRVVRVAESAPDFSTVINATGKYITHGINFDTDSDRLKPDSAPVLKMVAAGLSKNPNLKLEIDGYTDSVGDSGHNLDLSQRRAKAVQSVLVSQFGVDAARLSANGFGTAQPIGSNDTPDGRAANRRVEFIKK